MYNQCVVVFTHFSVVILHILYLDFIRKLCTLKPLKSDPAALLLGKKRVRKRRWYWSIGTAENEWILLGYIFQLKFCNVVLRVYHWKYQFGSKTVHIDREEFLLNRFRVEIAVIRYPVKRFVSRTFLAESAKKRNTFNFLTIFFKVRSITQEWGLFIAGAVWYNALMEVWRGLFPFSVRGTKSAHVERCPLLTCHLRDFQHYPFKVSSRLLTNVLPEPTE